MIDLIIKIFLIGFFINLLYELLHSLLFKTCIEAPLKKYIYLMIKAAVFDGSAIAIIYIIANGISSGFYQMIIFVIISVLFAYSWEIYSIKAGKWEYSDSMPVLLGAGVTPIVQLALTGLISIYIAINLFV